MATTVLVAYASRHGATRGIAERIAETLKASGLEVMLQDLVAEKHGAAYDAYVIGSAAYAGKWLGEAGDYVRRNQTLLASRPVWLFSSGPTGTETVDKHGRDIREASEPVEFKEFEPVLHPRGRRVFWGAWDPNAEPIGFLEKFGMGILKHLPAEAQEAMPAGDFRDWNDIETWARQIAFALQPAAVIA